MRNTKIVLGLAIALLPSWLKIFIYRHLFGYRIGKGVRIGFAPFIGVRRCRIGDHTRIGPGNAFYRIEDLEIGSHVRVGSLNLFRGGDRIGIGPYATILRQNVFNAIIDGDFTHSVESRLEIGTGASISSGHWLDFSAGLRVGDHTIIGGRCSSFWTHNRQRGRPIAIGRNCYLGSDVKVAPGVEVAPFCIVALGAVLTGRYLSERSLIGGNPACVVRSLDERDLFLVTRKTRRDIPDDLAYGHLSSDLREIIL